MKMRVFLIKSSVSLIIMLFFGCTFSSENDIQKNAVRNYIQENIQMPIFKNVEFIYNSEKAFNFKQKRNTYGDIWELSEYNRVYKITKHDSLNYTVLISPEYFSSFENDTILLSKKYMKLLPKYGRLTDYELLFNLHGDSVVDVKVILHAKKSNSIRKYEVPNMQINFSEYGYNDKIRNKESDNNAIMAKEENITKIMGYGDFWNKFDPIVKERIYELIVSKDCKGLQKEFNIAADNMDRVQSSGKSGGKFLDLMEFIIEKKEELHCN